MDFNKALVSFVNYLIKFQSDYKLLTSHSFGRFKTSFKLEYAALKLITNDDITKENFYRMILIIFEHYNQLLCDPLNHISLSLIPNFKLLIDDFTNNKCAEICSTKKDEKFDISDCAVLNTILDSYLVFESSLNKTNTNITSQSENQQKSFPNNFKDSLGLFRIQYEKMSRNNNNVNILDTHLSAQPITVPQRLMYFNFPEPWLPYDEYCVTEHNKLVANFQIDCMKLSKEYCSRRITANTDQILKLKNHYKDVIDIDLQLNALKENIDKRTKKEFDEKHTAILSFKPQYFKTAVCVDLTNSQSENNKHNKSLNHSNSSQSMPRNSNNKRPRFNDSSNYKQNQSYSNHTNNDNKNIRYHNNRNNHRTSNNFKYNNQKRNSTPNRSSTNNQNRENFHHSDSFNDQN
jgi:hypothetical protein